MIIFLKSFKRYKPLINYNILETYNILYKKLILDKLITIELESLKLLQTRLLEANDREKLS